MQRPWNAYYTFWCCIPINPYEQLLVLYNYIYFDSLSYWLFFCFLFFSEFPLINLGSFSLGTVVVHLLYICCCWIPSAFYVSNIFFVFWRIFFSSGKNLSLPVIFIQYFEGVIPLLAGFCNFHWQVSIFSYFALLKEMFPSPH